MYNIRQHFMYRPTNLVFLAPAKVLDTLSVECQIAVIYNGYGGAGLLSSVENQKGAITVQILGQ